MQPHWEKVYGTKAAEQVSWYRPHLETSLRLVETAAAGDRNAGILDVGGGASTLVDDLLERGFADVTVLDISEAALDAARQRLGPRGAGVRWIRADATQARLPDGSFDVWHDRAVFHFLTQPEERRAYVANATSALKPGGQIVIATFGPAGPVKCSGLDVVRYDAGSLCSEFGPRFQLLDNFLEEHATPSGATQQFLYCRFAFTPSGWPED